MKHRKVVSATANFCKACGFVRSDHAAWERRFCDEWLSRARRERLARETRRFKRLPSRRAAVRTVRGHLAELRHYEQGGM